MADGEPLRTAAALTCAECGRRWVDPAERWRVFLTLDDEAALYCPGCAAREFVDAGDD